MLRLLLTGQTVGLWREIIIGPNELLISMIFGFQLQLIDCSVITIPKKKEREKKED